MACEYPRCGCMYSVDVCLFDDSPCITNPAHGGKVTCHKCGGFIRESAGEGHWDHQHKDEFPHVWFHKNCYNRYEHYYGLDKPLD